MGGAVGGARLTLRIVYVVRSIYFNFQPNRTIFTIPMEKTVKTGFLRRYGGVPAAVCALKSHHDLYQMSSIFICELKQCKLCIYRNIIEKCMYFYKSAAVTAVGGAGGGAKLILRIVYVVRSIYFNFQPNRTIFTMFSSRTAKSPH